MRVALSVLASLTLATSFALADPVAKESPWHMIGTSKTAVFEVLKSSMSSDGKTMSRQFTMRTTLKTPINGPNGTKVAYFVENVLALCRENMFITMTQLQYNSKGALVNSSTTADVYRNLQVLGDPISHIMEFTCGRKPIAPQEKNLVQT